MRRTLLVAAVLGAAFRAPAHAYCPCYAPGSPANTYNCGTAPVAGTNLSTAAWNLAFLGISRGPSQWGTSGPTVANISQGCNLPEPLHYVPAVFPCEVLQALAMQESGWRQFCVPTSPADQAGGAERTLISFDCGYGISQVTSGMHVGDNPAFQPSRVAAEPLYNLATGAKILAGKWDAVLCVGDNQPKVVEHWYSALWAYNGLAYVNNPNNPVYSSSRGVWNPNTSAAAPYQEKVLGWMEHPPNSAFWNSLAVAYPKLASIGGGSAPPNLPEPSCASPTSCSQARPTHLSECWKPGPDGGVNDSGTLDAGKPDAGRVDAGAPDAGKLDAGQLDAGSPDGGTTDAGPADSGVLDASAADSGQVPSSDTSVFFPVPPEFDPPEGGSPSPDPGSVPLLPSLSGDTSCGCDTRGAFPASPGLLALLVGGFLKSRPRRRTPGGRHRR